jgi:hypothetical protein
MAFIEPAWFPGNPLENGRHTDGTAETLRTPRLWATGRRTARCGRAVALRSPIVAAELVRQVQDATGAVRALHLVVVRSGQLVLAGPAQAFADRAEFTGRDRMVTGLRTDSHVSNLLRKTNTTNRIELAQKYRRLATTRPGNS